jgi:hypothetical protein
VGTVTAAAYHIPQQERTKTQKQIVMTRNQFIHHVVAAYAHNFTHFQELYKDTDLEMIKAAKELADKVAKEAPFDSK